ncbi:hypothetical protein THRCLA_22773 [Thraustotheca clavata]|uniref:Secreted protein n=1 Tax=Thraustotheca clavata TaxID=74557 RepID=A0A1V9YT64_9STRA|nr:hypothetical protein THRCLA_22773 [Thraustotheca clavata]
MIRRLFWILLVCGCSYTLALHRSTVDQAKSLLRQAAGPLWFHESDTFGVNLNGGPNGCVNTRMGANAGVLGVIKKIDQIRGQLGFAMSKADLVVLGYPNGQDLLGDFKTGRPDVFFCDFQNVLPNPTGDISTVQQAVLGGAHQTISVFSGAFDDTPGAFDNAYFTSYLTKQWVKTQSQGNNFWAASDNSQTIRFNVDFAMAIHTRTCQVKRGCPKEQWTESKLSPMTQYSGIKTLPLLSKRLVQLEFVGWF